MAAFRFVVTAAQSRHSPEFFFLEKTPRAGCRTALNRPNRHHELGVCLWCGATRRGQFPIKHRGYGVTSVGLPNRHSRQGALTDLFV